MSRSLLIAALLAQVTLAQEPSPPVRVFGTFDTAYRPRPLMQSDAVPRSSTPSAASPISLIRAHLARERQLDAVTAARALLSASPADMAAGIRALNEGLFGLPDDGTALKPAVRALVADLNASIAKLPLADGAEAAIAMVWFEYTIDREDEDAHKRRMAQFESTYRGTPAYINHMISQVESLYGYDAAKTRPRFLELAREYDGTEFGAHALYSLGFRLAHDAVSSPREIDPTERFLEVLAIVKDLEGGRFPKCEWVDEAPKLIIEFSTFQPEYSKANTARIYDAYLGFVASHLAGDKVPRSSIVYRVETGLAELPRDKREALPLIERFIVDLMKSGVAADDALALQAGVYLSILGDNSMERFPVTPSQAADGARKSLLAVAQSATPRVRAQALADLASLDFHLGRYREARGQYLALVGTYPSDAGWVALLRAAEAREALGDVAGAAVEYEAIVARFAGERYPVAMAGVAAGETREAENQFALAAQNYRAAVAAWPDPAERMMIYTQQAAEAKPLPNPVRFNNLTLHHLQTRLGRLESAITPEGALVHQARLAIEAEKPRDAITPLQRVLDQYGGSPVVAEARLLLRRARFDAALIEHGRRDAGLIDRELEALTRGDYDEMVRAAKLARAALLLQRGSASRAESLTKAALEEWYARQAPPARAADAYDEDVAAIRRVLFLPKGGGVLRDGWNAFEWPKQVSAFVLLNRDLVVRTPDDKESTRAVSFVPAGGERAIFLTPDDFRTMRAILDKIGGTDTREPGGIMETPNQPVGGAVAIAALWGKFFHVRPGHWEGWELGTYPYLSKITFDREGHALAEVTIGYSGGTIELVKENGVWIAKRMVSEWIT